MTIQYIKGDATKPIGDDYKIICHICNDIGCWGAGFVLAVSRRWSAPEKIYRESYVNKNDTSLALGVVQFVPVEDDIVVANMICQNGIIYRNYDGPPPIRYEAVRSALRKLADYSLSHKGSVHMPRIGAGLARGDWSIIEKIIEEELVSRGVAVTVYDPVY